MVNLAPVNQHVQGWLVCLMFWRSYFVVCAVLVLCVELYQCDHVKGIGAARARTHTRVLLTTTVFSSFDSCITNLACRFLRRILPSLVLGWICTCYHMGRLGYCATKRFAPSTKNTHHALQRRIRLLNPCQSYRAAKSWSSSKHILEFFSIPCLFQNAIEAHSKNVLHLRRIPFASWKNSVAITLDNTYVYIYI